MYTQIVVANSHSGICRLLQYTTQRVFGQQVQVEFGYTPPALYARLKEGQAVPQLLLVNYHFVAQPATAVEVINWIRVFFDRRATPQYMLAGWRSGVFIQSGCLLRCSGVCAGTGSLKR